MEKARPYVLLVDDDKYLIEAYQLTLQKQGYDVDIAFGQQEALTKMEKRVPHIVFIDVFLDHSDGRTLLNIIKGKEEYARVFCVLISGIAKNQADIALGLSKGADAYLTKPLTNKELVAHTSVFMKQRQAINKLLKSEQRLQKLIRFNPDAILVISRQGKIRFANPAAEKLLNQSHDQLVNSDFGVPSVENQSAEVSVLAKNGEDKLVKMNLVEEEWEEEPAYIATLRNITPQRKAELRVENLNSLLQAIRKINQLIVHSDSMEELFNSAAVALLNTRTYKGVTIALINAETEMIEPFSIEGDHHFPDKWKISVHGEGNAPPCIKSVADRKKTLIYDSFSLCNGCPNQKKFGKDYYEVLIAPLLHQGKILGILAITLAKGENIDNEELELIESVSNDLAYAYDKHHLQSRLFQTEAKYTELFERSPVGIFQTTSAGNIVSINTEMARILGYKSVKEAKLKTENLRNNLYYRPQRRDEFLELLNKYGIVNSFAYEALDASGNIRWIEMSAIKSSENSDGTFLIDGFAWDITEERKNQQELKISENRYRSLFESSRDAILVADLNRNIIDCNKATLDIFGYSRKEIIGKQTLQLYNDKKEFERMGEVLKEQKEPGSTYFTVYYQKSNGDIFPGETNVFPLLDEEGNPQAFVGLIRDITKRVEAYEKLQKTLQDYQELNEEYQAQNEEYEVQNEKLSQHLEQIREMNEELKKAKQKAEENDRLKSAFLANMSHEIRTPMNAIIGFSDLIVSEELPKEEQDKYLDVIVQKGESLLRLIDTLIDTAKIEGEQLQLHPESFDVNKLMNEILETNKMLLSKSSDKKHVDIRVSKAKPNEKMIMKMDVHRLKQVINNLLSNAIKYTTEGLIELGYTLKDNVITFFVSDTGSGIPYNEQPHIFERFRRGKNQHDPSTKKLIGGTGIGLSIVKDLTKLMGGSIHFVSTPGEGTAFYVDFRFEPVSDSKPKEINPSSVELSDLSGRKVLIVEDEAYNLEYLVSLLRKCNGEVITAPSGESALERMNDNPDTDLVLMDIKLPGIDGFEATKKIKNENNEVVVIAQTAYAMPEDQQEAKKAGCDDYVTKPINKWDLYKAINTHLKPRMEADM
ncbi:MAG: PAS domain S-box protein [Bacteroidota bacterium]